MEFRPVHELKDPLCIAFPKLYISGLNNEDWKILEDLIDVLKTLDGATKTLCGDTQSTLSMVIPSINKLIEHTTTLTSLIVFWDNSFLKHKYFFLNIKYNLS